MKFKFTVVVSKKNLRGVKVRVCFGRLKSPIEAEVETYSIPDYIKEFGDSYGFFYRFKDTEGLVVLRIVSTFNHKDVHFFYSDEDGQKITVYDMSYFTTGKRATVTRKIVYPSTEDYTTLESRGNFVVINNCPIETWKVKEILADVKEEIEGVVWGLFNPFPRCNVGRIKVLDICRETREPGMIEPYFEEYASILDSIHTKHGNDAFGSLTRIGGTSRELDYFFSLFSNREFEYIILKDNTIPSTRGLSVDMADIVMRDDEKEKPMDPKVFRRVENSSLEMDFSKYVFYEEIGERNIFKEDDDCDWRKIDLSHILVSEKGKMTGSYNYFTEVQDESEDSDSDCLETVRFSLMFDFMRLNDHKSAKF